MYSKHFVHNKSKFKKYRDSKTITDIPRFLIDIPRSLIEKLEISVENLGSRETRFMKRYSKFIADNPRFSTTDIYKFFDSILQDFPIYCTFGERMQVC